MPTRCTRCRGVDGAHHPWCIQAVMFEGGYEVNPTGALPVWDGIEEFEWPTTSVATAVSSDLVAELRERLDQAVSEAEHLTDELAQSQRTTETLREQRDRLATELDEARAATATAGAIALPKGTDPATIAKLAELIETEGDAVTALMRDRDKALERASTAEDKVRLAQGELRTARQQIDNAIRERDKARKLISDPAALREQRKREAEEIRALARQTQQAQGERVVDRDAGQEDVARPKVEGVIPPGAPRNVVATMVMAGEKSAGEKASAAVVESDGTLAEAQAAARAEGATLEVTVEPVTADEAQAMTDHVSEEIERNREESRPLTESEQRSKEAADLVAAAELFVAEHTAKATGSYVKVPDLVAAFEEFLPQTGFVRKWSTDQALKRQVGSALGKAGYGKRQVFDPETQSAPIRYLDVALVNIGRSAPRESDTKEGNHRGGLIEEVDHTAGVAAMQRAAREAKAPPRDLTKGNPGLPGREIKNTDLRKMITTLVQEQGWRYEKPTGRGHPRVFSPDGQLKKLSTTPGDVRGLTKARSDLRRMGAKL